MTDEEKAIQRQNTLAMLQRAMTRVNSGEAYGAVVVLVDEHGHFVYSGEDLPPYAVAYADATMALDFVRDALRSTGPIVGPTPTAASSSSPIRRRSLFTSSLTGRTLQ